MATPQLTNMRRNRSSRFANKDTVHRALRHNSRSVAVRALRQGPQWVFGPMTGMHAATPVTHSDDYTDDQTAYRLGQRAQVEERSATVGSRFSGLTFALNSALPRQFSSVWLE